MLISEAVPEDAGAILALQRLSFWREAEIYGDFTIAPLTETLADLSTAISAGGLLKAVEGETIVGAVRGAVVATSCKVGRLMVHPDMRRRGIAVRLMLAIESWFVEARAFELFTGHLSTGNLRLYSRLGYRETSREVVDERLTLVHMRKERMGG